MKTLYISDLDGTLFDSSGHLSGFTSETINSLVAKGLDFTIATARSISSASGLVEELDITLPGVMMNGVFLTDIHKNIQRKVCFISRQKAREVVRAFLECERPPIVFSFDGNICAEYTRVKNDYEKSFIAKRKKLYYRFDKVENYNITGNIVYINGIDDKKTMDAVVEKLKKIDGIKFSYYLDVYSKDKYFIEVYSDEAGKKNTVEYLKKEYGFDRVVAFGDNANDIEMLKAADVGVAVGNAGPEVKESADIIIGSNDDDGVARYLLDLYKKGEL
ncbi:MAG: HAD family hydrolase [Clostridia bacterium]|nr:HAD family hydrolase [Clostridia bacterium]